MAGSALLGCLGIALLGAASPRATLYLQDRSSAPRGPSEGEMLAELSVVLAEETGLTLASLEQLGVERAELAACPIDQSFGCWAELAGAGEDRPRFLLAAALEDGEGAPLLSLLLLDVERARALLGVRAHAETRIFTEAVTRAERTAVPPGGLRRALVDALRGPLRAPLERAGLFGRPAPGPSAAAGPAPAVPPARGLAPGEAALIRGGVAGALAVGLTLYTTAASPGGALISACPVGTDCAGRERHFPSFCELAAERPSGCAPSRLGPLPLALALGAYGAVELLLGGALEERWSWLWGAAAGLAAGAVGVALAQ